MDELAITPPLEDGSLVIRPIGVVRSAVAAQQTGGFQELQASIVLRPEFAGWLEGLDGYSHLIVIYWLGEQTRAYARTQPQGHPEAPRVGMFACRCPQRPNPVGLTTVKLDSIDGTTLNVSGLDAIEGTPVIDIKPYTPPYDVPHGHVRFPDWVSKLSY